MDKHTHSDNLPCTDIPLEKFKEEFEQLKEKVSSTSKNNEEITSDSSMAIIHNLPELLRTSCLRLSNSSEQMVFLMGAIGVISGIIPNVHGLYHGSFVHPNLFVFVVAKFGTGKGVLNFAKFLGQPIHDAKKAEAEIARKEYHEQMLQYDKDLTAFQKNKSSQLSVPVKPVQPNQKLLFIPANNSKSGFFELLHSNQGQGIIFETEADTLYDAIRQEYGDYSDGLRRAFQHETISFYRRAGKEFVEIELPQLSTVLSGTNDQLFRLIPSIENGLFSRFIFFEMKSTGLFNNPFDASKAGYLDFFKNLGTSMLHLYQKLATLDKPVEFLLTHSQQQQFLNLFQLWKQEIREYVSEDLDGSINRLGLICFRLAMIFTVLRAYENGNLLTGNLMCEEQDFETAISLSMVIKKEALRIFYKMPESKKQKQPDSIEVETLKRIAKEKHALGLSYQDIANLLRKPRSTVYRWVNT